MFPQHSDDLRDLIAVVRAQSLIGFYAAKEGACEQLSIMINALRICPKCGAEIPADAPEGGCPVAFLRWPRSASRRARSCQRDLRLGRFHRDSKKVRRLRDYTARRWLFVGVGRGGMGVTYLASRQCVASQSRPESDRYANGSPHALHTLCANVFCAKPAPRLLCSIRMWLPFITSALRLMLAVIASTRWSCRGRNPQRARVRREGPLNRKTGFGNCDANYAGIDRCRCSRFDPSRPQAWQHHA